MPYQNPDIEKLANDLKTRVNEGPSLLRSPEFRAFFDQLKTLPPEQRGLFGKELNQLKQELEELTSGSSVSKDLSPIDVTAPFDVNTPADKRPKLLPTELGSQHPLTSELAKVLDIFARMGFEA